MWELGERIVQRAGVLRGEDVLDVACGTGSAAIRAAQSGARVVGLDLTPPLFDAARREAAQARTDVRWVSGDAAAMPFSDGSFDVVLSVFGAALAPRQRATARELARVLRRWGGATRRMCAACSPAVACACPSATRSPVTRCSAPGLSPNRSSTTPGSSGR